MAALRDNRDLLIKLEDGRRGMFFGIATDVAYLTKSSTYWELGMDIVYIDDMLELVKWSEWL